MIRRNKTLNPAGGVGAPRSSGNEALRGTAPSSFGRGPGGAKQRRGDGDEPFYCSTWFLLLLAALVTVATYIFPDEVAQAEHEAEVLIKEEVKDLYAAEQNLMAWAQGGGGGDSSHAAPIPEHLHPDFQESSTDATKRMLAQDSTWVDGEKKLKAKLKVLAERQKEGKDLGVPVLTRYVGEDIPAWPSEGMDKDTWQAKVDARYKEMRDEEEVWKAKMAALLKHHPHG